MSCKKAWTVFADKKFDVAEEVDAKKNVYNGEDAWKIVAGAEKVIVASGKKVIEYEPAAADKTEMLKKISGRTGNLRAPTLKVGNTYYVGFNQAMYDSL